MQRTLKLKRANATGYSLSAKVFLIMPIFRQNKPAYPGCSNRKRPRNPELHCYQDKRGTKSLILQLRNEQSVK